jgi:hypothetical protein
MRKLIALFLCAAAIFTAAAGCAKKEPNIVFTGTIEEVNDASILVTTGDDVGFDRARVHIPDDIKISFDLLIGQIVKVTILPLIAESYPVQVTAVAIELVSEPASPDPAYADYTASFVRADAHVDGGWDFIRKQAANADKMVVGSVRHIYVIAIDSAGALADFVTKGKTMFLFDQAYNGEVSFSENAVQYDAAFFESNTLLVLCTEESSGSIRHEIGDAAISGDTLSVAVKTIVPEAGTDDMADWFILLELPNAEITGVEKYDAFYA